MTELALSSEKQDTRAPLTRTASIAGVVFTAFSKAGGKMNIRRLLVAGSTMLSATLGAAAGPEEMRGRYVQVAEIEIDPAQLDAYKAAVTEHIETAIRVEPGVLVLYSVSETDNPTRIRVFEIYADAQAYRAHMEAPHFKRYKAVTEHMVTSLKLVRVDPVALGAKVQ